MTNLDFYNLYQGHINKAINMWPERHFIQPVGRSNTTANRVRYALNYAKEIGIKVPEGMVVGISEGNIYLGPIKKKQDSIEVTELGGLVVKNDTALTMTSLLHLHGARILTKPTTLTTIINVLEFAEDYDVEVVILSPNVYKIT